MSVGFLLDHPYENGIRFTVKPSAISPSADTRAKGTKYVYQAQVLAGKCIMPSQVSRDAHGNFRGPNHDTYHSVVDDAENPNTYFVFSGDQAYPEYLIMFQ